MKRVIGIIAIVLVVAVLFCSCGKKDMGRLNYNYDMSKIVKLDSYAIEVDSSSETYKEYYNKKISELLTGEIFDGIVQNEDIANIDYVGTKDGEAFAGGTAKGYDLTIGSGTFIPGFEDGLIGKEIGTTVELPLTFPEDYGNSSLAGQPVVFTVTINSCKRTFSELNDENAVLLGYSNAAELEKEASDYAKKLTAWSEVYAKATIEEYPKEETEVFVDMIVYSTDIELQQQDGFTLQQYLTIMGSSMEAFRNSAREGSEVAQMKKNYAICYYIIDTEGVNVTAQMVDDKIATGINSSIKRNFVEMLVVMDMAQKIVGEKATLK